MFLLGKVAIVVHIRLRVSVAGFIKKVVLLDLVFPSVLQPLSDFFGVKAASKGH